MGRRATWLIVLVAGAATAAQPARAQEYGATARVDRPIPAGSDVDPTAAATVVDAQDDPRALASTEELLLGVPGARVRRLGAYGSVSSLSLRGADPEHTTVLIGDVPVGGVDGAAFDLSTIPLSLLERVEVYRGGAPVWLGAGGIGGVLRLVPRERPATAAEASGGAGSFGTVTAHGAVSVVAPTERALGWTALAGVTRSAGDFPYVYDNGTTLDATDDVERERGNGETLDGYGLGQLHAAALGGEVSALALGFSRAGGVPGPAVQETHHTHRWLTRTLVATSYDRAPRGAPPFPEDAAWRARALASVSYERARFTDRLGEIGLGARATDDVTLRTLARLGGSLRLAPWLGVTALASYALDLYDPEDALARVPNRRSTRHVVSGAVELPLRARLGGARIEVRPSARLDAARAELVETREERAGETAGDWTIAPTARLGAVVEVVRGIALSASGATATRLPSMLELFGDRGYLQGDTRLSPERSWTADAGAVARGHAGVVRGALELRGFALAVRDLIRYRRTSQFTAVPENVGSATILGAEAGAHGDVGSHFALTASVTWTEARSGDDRVLPFRPRLEAYARPEVGLGPIGAMERVTVFGDVTHVGSNFVDGSNLVVVGARTHFGAGIAVSLWRDAIEASVAVRDIADARGFDMLGFPLPGRSFAAELTWHTERAP